MTPISFMVVLVVLMRLTLRWAWVSTLLVVTRLSTPAMAQAGTTNTFCHTSRIRD